jgi:hypothetical protein
MIKIPNETQKIAVEGSTVEFFVFEMDETTYYLFDTSSYGPPEPMVNAMAGLRLIDAPNKKLIMINHTAPMGLFDKIGGDFGIEQGNTENGNIMVIFSYKAPVDLNKECYGGSCSH